MDDVMKALKHMKVEKAAGYDRVLSEMLRGGGGAVASLLYQLFNKCWKSHKVPNDRYKVVVVLWCKVVIVPLYKKGKTYGSPKPIDDDDVWGGKTDKQTCLRRAPFCVSRTTDRVEDTKTIIRPDMHTKWNPSN
ncbi:hypothetical protein EVAR_33141_1 [Eumeta japonica]|uniref:Uncharacterized protein n=1 Tax=Eumeta variegata TaxID=151549 RepID=A0A4C1Y751_EUMVA|nr:hypothetical protein EVAR_33141_1 [Eumeta japonica]